MITQWLTLLGLMLVIGLWLASMRGRERALRAARGICQAQSVQLLDETVGLSGARLRRHQGWLQWHWRYAFEVSLHGHDRYAGHLWMAGGRVVGLHAEWPAPPANVLDMEPGVAALLARVRRQDDEGAT